MHAIDDVVISCKLGEFIIKTRWSYEVMYIPEHKFCGMRYINIVNYIIIFFILELTIFFYLEIVLNLSNYSCVFLCTIWYMLWIVVARAIHSWFGYQKILLNLGKSVIYKLNIIIILLLLNDAVFNLLDCFAFSTEYMQIHYMFYSAIYYKRWSY